MTADLSGVKVSVDAVERGPKDISGYDTVIVTLTTTNNTSSAQPVVSAAPIAFSGRQLTEGNVFGLAVYPAGKEPDGLGLREDAPENLEPGKSATWKLAYAMPQTADEVSIQLMGMDQSKGGPWTVKLPN